MNSFEDLSSIFGARLKHLRETAKLTQSALAKLLGVSRGAVSFYENGDRLPNIDFIQKASHFFKVDYDYLMGEISTYHGVSTKDFSNFSNETIRYLQNVHDAYESTNFNVLDNLLKNEDFHRLMYYTCELSHAYYERTIAHMNGKNPVMRDSSGARIYSDYIEYKLSRLLSGLCGQVAHDSAYSQFTDSEKQQYNIFCERMREYIKSGEKDPITQKYEQMQRELEQSNREFDEKMKQYRDNLSSLSVITEDTDYETAAEIVYRRIHGTDSSTADNTSEHAAEPDDDN